MNILLVDDDAFLRDMYATKFSEQKHMVDTAETVEEAITKLREKTYDVALIDMVMPGKSGTELIAQIKSEKLGGEPVCIVLSNQSEEHDKQAALAAGAAGYIVKAELIPSEVIAEVVKIAS
jgi:two-component system, OmpR family, response regulator PhoP